MAVSVLHLTVSLGLGPNLRKLIGELLVPRVLNPNPSHNPNPNASLTLAHLRLLMYRLLLVFLLRLRLPH